MKLKISFINLGAPIEKLEWTAYPVFSFEKSTKPLPKLTSKISNSLKLEFVQGQFPPLVQLPEQKKFDHRDFITKYFLNSDL